MTRNPRPSPEDFAAATRYWHLDGLYADLADIKGGALSPGERQDLRALLLGNSPVQIAEKLGLQGDTVRKRLSSTLYAWVKDLVFAQTSEVVETIGYTEVPVLLRKLRYDRGRNGAPEVRDFYGRTEELQLLQQWIVGDRCRLVVLWGLTGIGKTALSVKLLEQLHLQFDWTIWRSLESAPPLTEFLSDLNQQLPDHGESSFETATDPVQCLLERLRTHRYLLILDGIEVILSHPALREQYSRLLKRIGESPLQSCVLVTSQEKSKELQAIAGNNRPTRFYKLEGLTIEDSKEIFREHKLLDEMIWQDVIEKYRCHPFFLKQLALMIQEQFNGKVSKFLRLNTVFLGDFPDFLAAGVNQLESIEKEIMKWLSTCTTPVLLEDLAQRFKSHCSTSDLIHALECLLHKDLIEKVLIQDDVSYQLIPTIKKLIRSRLLT